MPAWRGEVVLRIKSRVLKLTQNLKRDAKMA
jgi:hypothetical protein